MDLIFHKSLPDLVKGLRSQSNTQEYVSKCMNEIREELKSQRINQKVMAVQKLTYVNKKFFLKNPIR